MMLMCSTNRKTKSKKSKPRPKKVMLYGHALTAVEVRELFNSQK